MDGPKSSKRILVISKREAGALELIKGSTPIADISGSIAGLTHEWHAVTTYYKTVIPIWVDEITEPSAWQAEFLKPEAREVVEAVGAWIYVFQPAADGQIPDEAQAFMRCVQRVVEEHGGTGSEAVMLAVVKPVGIAKNRSTKSADEQGETSAVQDQEEQEDVCLGFGFEYIDYQATGKNQFGEKVGFERLKEALEATEWPTTSNDGDGLENSWLDTSDDEAEAWSGMDREEAEWTSEFFGVKAALHDSQSDDQHQDNANNVAGSSAEDQASQVDDLDRLLGRLLQVKERSAGLPEAERKRIAAEAVRDVMKGM